MSPRTTAEPRATVQAIWRTRPSRRQSDRKIAGVCAAIARRYDVDPVLVRIGFVVAAFYGVGFLMYLAAWIALPADPDDRPAGLLSGRTGSLPAHPVVVVATVIAGVFALGSLVRGSPAVLVGLAVAAGLLYLLHENRSDRGQGGADSRPGGAAAAAGAAPSDAHTPGAHTPDAHTPGVHTPDAHTPGAHAATVPGVTATASAMTAVQDAPVRGEPAAPQPPDGPPRERRPRSMLAPATIGLALLAGGVTGALVLVTGGQAGPRLIVGVMLAVVGLGLVAGAFARRGRTLVLVAVPLLLAGYVTTRAGELDFRQTGDLRIAPTAVSQLAPSYRRGFGDVTVDLRNLDLSAPAAPAAPAPPPTPALPGPQPSAQPTPRPADQPETRQPTAMPPTAPPTGPPVHTLITLRAGDVDVTLPPNADVTVHCRAELGDVECLGQNMDGRGADVRTTDLGADGTASGRPLDIEIVVGAGEVRVTRG